MFIRKTVKKVERRFQELEDQSYPVLKFEVEIRTLLQVGGCKLDLTLFSLKGIEHHVVSAKQEQIDSQAGNKLLG